MSKAYSLTASLSSVAVATLILAGTAAQATEGYFQLGYGARQSAMGGGGVADSRDAMALALNPAGIAGLDGQVQLGAAAFIPKRGFDLDYSGSVTSYDSRKEFFLVPNFAYTRGIDADTNIGLTIYGNGGMNTAYNYIAPENPVFGTSDFGVDLMQAFISLGVARRLGNIKVGIAPTVAIQRFAARGLEYYTATSENVVSADPANVTNNGYDYSVGAGLRAGMEFAVTDNARIAVAGQTKMYMSPFDKYSGLFEGGGDFDIPASITAGLAIDMTPDITFTFDYQHIFYDGVPAVSNAGNAGLLGANGGGGFGWSNVNAYKFGMEFRVSPEVSLRAGYAYNNNPIGTEDVTFGILAPGVVKQHFTGGLAFNIGDGSTIELSGIYAPEQTISAVTGLLDTPTATLRMHQYQFMMSVTHKF